MTGSGPHRAPVVAAIGMATVDYLYLLDDHPQPDTVTRALEHQVVVGGVAGRGALTARRLGDTAKLLAACGTDIHAQVLRSGLEAEGVECTWVAYDQPSQHSAVIVARAQATRTIIWLPQPMADDRLTGCLPEFLDGVDAVVIDATDGVLAGAALDECLRRGITSVLDTGSGRPWTAGLMSRADHVVAPEKFVRKLTDHPAERAASELWDGSCRQVLAVTQGAKGGVYATGSEPARRGRWKAAPVAAVDSNGAGDTFHGAYAWALAHSLPVPECFDLAAWAAALKAAQLGNAGIPTLQQLEAARRASDAGPLAAGAEAGV